MSPECSSIWGVPGFGPVLMAVGRSNTGGGGVGSADRAGGSCGYAGPWVFGQGCPLSLSPIRPVLRARVVCPGPVSSNAAETCGVLRGSASR